MSDYRALISLFEAYGVSQGQRFTIEQNSVFLEVKRRIQQLEILFTEVMELNQKLLDASKSWLPQIELFMENGNMMCSENGKKRVLIPNCEDPRNPVQINKTSGPVLAYVAGVENNPNPEEESLKLAFEAKLENFYYCAHKVLDLCNDQLKLDIKCREITFARNHLIEHTQGRCIYSFVYGSSGPALKPARPQGEDEFQDLGLIHNSQAFIAAASKKLA